MNRTHRAYFDYARGENTKVAMEAGKPVATFPIPGMPGAIAKATLNAENQAERVETRLGNVVTEFTYEKYHDYNPADDKVYGYFPGHIVEKRNGVTILDLTVKQTRCRQSLCRDARAAECAHVRAAQR